MQDYRQLKVWQVAVQLSGLIFERTTQFPKTEREGLVDQMRRSSVSISSNIAEGSRRIHFNEKRQFYSIAYGSAAELDTQIRISKVAKLGALKKYPAIEDVMDHTLRLLALLLKRFHS